MAKMVKYEAWNGSHIRLIHTADLHAFPAMLATPRSMQQRRARAARVKQLAPAAGPADFLFASFQNKPLSTH